jgi:hypothetical protein
MKQFMTVAPDGRVDALYDREDGAASLEVDGFEVIEVEQPFANGWPAGPTDTSMLHWVGGALAWVETASLDELKASKNAEINGWRAAANQATFPHAGKLVACDALSRSDIDAVANHIGLFGTFPTGFPMAWKATDNTYIPLPDVAAFKALYASMTAQGTANFEHSQDLKVALGNASAADAVAAIVW